MLAALVIICAVTSADKCVVIATEPVFTSEKACNDQANAFLKAEGKHLKAKLHGDYSALVWCREIKGVES
jgi:hypothetical protein